MRKNTLLVVAIFISILLAFNSFRKIAAFRVTSNLVIEQKEKLENLKRENEQLKRELEYKKSERFVEEEIRNKLGLAKEGEEIIVVPKKETDIQQSTNNKKNIPNWKKWKNLLFGV